MNLQQIITELVATQEASTLPPADFYRALLRLARMDGMLRTALQPSTWTTGVPHPLPTPDNPIPGLAEGSRAAQDDRGTPSGPEKAPSHSP